MMFERLLPDDMEQHQLFDHVVPPVLSWRGHLVLHGGWSARRGWASSLPGIEPDATSSVAGKVRVDDRTEPFRQDPVTLCLVAVLAVASPGLPASFTSLASMAAHAALFGSTFHAELGGGRLLPAVVDRLGAILEGVTVGQLNVPRGQAGLQPAESVLRARLERVS